MKKLRSALNRGGISFLAVLITTFGPVAGPRVVLAQAAPEETPAISQTESSTITTDSTLQQEDEASLVPSTPTTPPVIEEKPSCPEVPGADHPTGAGGHTFTLDTDTCLWENEYYSWSPITKKYTKKTPYDYKYNTVDEIWIRVEPPAPVVSTTGAESNTNTDSTVNNGLNVNAANSVSIINFLNAYSLTGNASVSGNRIGGNATSGDATTTANVVNMLQSSAGYDDGYVGVYSADIQGDVYGDLLFDPAALGNIQSSDSTINNDIDINIQNDASIDNKITLDAQSGDASVNDNRVGGNATSGDANAVLNLINMMNSSVSSGESFIAMLNIYGNLNGDILLPPELLNQLLANNNGAASNYDSSYIENTEILADFTNNQSISNDININAQSGTASVTGNRVGGNATSGNANANLTILNLTGHEVNASNSLLVFVNVLGTWVGLIMDAPGGSTAAALGSDVTRNTTVNNSIDIDVEQNSAINNDVDIVAQTGDASVAGNRVGGNATSGNATASANVVNMMNSNFALSDWFGILFINVFGTWNGSFGVDTAAGGLVGGMGGGPSAEEVEVFKFVPSESGDGRVRVEQANFAASSSGGTISAGSNETLAAALQSGTVTPEASSTGDNTFNVPVTSSEAAMRNYGLIIGSLAFGAILIGIERYLSLRRGKPMA